MAAVDYTGIQDQIESALKTDSRTNTARIFVEEEPQFGLLDAEKVVAVFLEGRSAPTSDQPAAAGKRTVIALRASCWVFAFSIESYRKACEARNSLLGNVELVLMDNRTLGGKVRMLWLEGGEMASARHPDGGPFVAIAETAVLMEVSAVNT